MSEREIADLKLKIKAKENQIRHLKNITNKQQHEIQELSILLHKKIRFMKEMRDRNGIMDKKSR